MQRLMPMIDIAYQGFGQGLEADVYGPRRAFQELHEAVLTTTCSKNFGVYRDRVAIAAVQTKSPENAARTLSRLTRLANVTYAMPADHAAAVVKTILTDEGLKWAWETELTTMRERIHSVRNSLAKALRGATNSDRFDFLERHKGMFSLLPLTDTQIDTLQNEHGIYLVKGGRANIAGLTKAPDRTIRDCCCPSDHQLGRLPKHEPNRCPTDRRISDRQWHSKSLLRPRRTE